VQEETRKIKRRKSHFLNRRGGVLQKELTKACAARWGGKERFAGRRTPAGMDPRPSAMGGVRQMTAVLEKNKTIQIGV
jgi:hypothetical protein